MVTLTEIGRWPTGGGGGGTGLPPGADGRILGHASGAPAWQNPAVIVAAAPIIATLQAADTALQAADTALDGRVTTNEGDIAALDTGKQDALGAGTDGQYLVLASGVGTPSSW